MTSCKQEPSPLSRNSLTTVATGKPTTNVYDHDPESGENEDRGREAKRRERSKEKRGS